MPRGGVILRRELGTESSGLHADGRVYLGIKMAGRPKTSVAI